MPSNMGYNHLAVCLSIIYLGLVLAQDDLVKVNFCCPEGQILRVKSLRNKIKAVCTRRRGLENDLEGKEVFLLNANKSDETKTTEYVKRKLSKLKTTKPECSRGLSIATLHLQESNNVTNGENNSIELRQYFITMEGGREGNVYINGKPLCGTGWDKGSARVACRMLGYGDGEPAEGSDYGWVETEEGGLDVFTCTGDEDSLYDCPQSSNECGSGVGAGVICSSIDGSAVQLSQSGQLMKQGQEIETEDYCLAENWENGFAKYDYVGVLSCDRCKEKVVCSYLQDAFKSLIENDGIIDKNPDNVLLLVNFVNVCDKNQDDIVTFEEFQTTVVEYLTLIFNILDKNKNGSVNALNVSMEIFSLELFEEILKQVIRYFDNNGDNAISTEDSNGSGQFPLADLIGLGLINLPAPIYTAYTLLDEDQDEVFTAEELLTFLRKLFTIIDKNENCYIGQEEFLDMLGENDLPNDYQLGVKLVAQHYLTLAQYFVDEFLAVADANTDGELTLEEALEFSGFDLIESSIPVAASMGQLPPGAAYLAGSQQSLVVWLTTLQSLLGTQEWDNKQETLCTNNQEQGA